MKHVLFVRCWRCGTSVMFGRLGYVNTGAQDAGVEESALTRVVRAVVDIATRKSARVLEGVCVDCALETRNDGKVPTQRVGGDSPPGEPPGSEPHLTQMNLYPDDKEVSSAS